MEVDRGWEPRRIGGGWAREAGGERAGSGIHKLAGTGRKGENFHKLRSISQ